MSHDLLVQMAYMRPFPVAIIPHTKRCNSVVVTSKLASKFKSEKKKKKKGDAVVVYKITV